MKNKIEFLKDGASFSFLFADGSEGFEIGSKESGFKVIMDLLKKSKITVEEFGKFQKQITQAENLPWNEKKKVEMSGLFGGLGLLSEFLPELIEIGLLSSILEEIHAPNEPVTIAYFKMCECGGDHGRIYFQIGYTGEIRSKKHAMNYLKDLQGKTMITVEEFAKVKTEIEGSKLPE